MFDLSLATRFSSAFIRFQFEKSFCRKIQKNILSNNNKKNKKNTKHTKNTKNTKNKKNKKNSPGQRHRGVWDPGLDFLVF